MFIKSPPVASLMVQPPWSPSHRLLKSAAVMCLVMLVGLSCPVSGTSHHVKDLMDTMRDVRDDQFMPSRWMDPMVPGANASDSLLCRANRTQWHKPPDYDIALNEQYSHLHAVPHGLPTCPALKFSTPMDGRWMRSEYGPEYVFHHHVDGVPGIPPSPPINGSGSTPESKESPCPSDPQPSCRLRRLSADQALTCLRNKHIMFIGDSTMRYTVTPLIYWLANDGRQDPHDPEPPRPGHIPSVCSVGHWGNWPQFYANFTTLHSEGVCMNTACVGPEGGTCDHGKIEKWRTEFALASGAHATISMYINLQCCESTTIDLLHHILNTSSPDRPDMLVFNHGIWFVMGGGGNTGAAELIRRYELMFQQAHEYVAAQPAPRTRLVYRATTTMFPQVGTADGLLHDHKDYKDWYTAWPLLEPMVKQLAHMYGIEYYDVDTPSRRSQAQGMHRMDGFHFQTYTNNMYNDLLFNILC